MQVLSLLKKTWEPTTDGINFAAHRCCEIDKHLADDAVGHFGCRQFQAVSKKVSRLQARPEIYLLFGGRCDGLRHADGSGGDPAPIRTGKSLPSWATAGR